MKLLRVIPSPLTTKKWRAEFSDGSHTDFGAAGYEDYTQHHDKDRRANYLKRHAPDLETGDVTRAGYLSYYILWGPSTSMTSNIRSYKKRFGM
jgi:hypothetical protein